MKESIYKNAYNFINNGPILKSACTVGIVSVSSMHLFISFNTHDIRANFYVLQVIKSFDLFDMIWKKLISFHFNTNICHILDTHDINLIHFNTNICHILDTHDIDLIHFNTNVCHILDTHDIDLIHFNTNVCHILDTHDIDLIHFNTNVFDLSTLTTWAF